MKIEHTHCCYCRRKFSEETGLLEKTKDHFYPTSRLGKNVVDNRLECCLECNRWKADRMPEDWLKIIEKLFSVKELYGTYEKKHLAQIVGSLRYWIKRKRGKKISQYKY